MLRPLLTVLPVLAALACGSSTAHIPGTEIPSTETNRSLIERVEEYRTAVERKDAAALLLMADERYWEDSGTPTGEDDYGYEGLKQVLASRFQEAESIRYAVRYKRIRQRGCEDEGVPCRAFVDVLIDASYTVPDERGNLKRHDKRDQNQLVLERVGERWKFLSGM